MLVLRDNHIFGRKIQYFAYALSFELKLNHWTSFYMQTEKPAPVACHIGCNMGSELRCLQYILLIFGDNQNIAHDITNYALLAFST